MRKLLFNLAIIIGIAGNIVALNAMAGEAKKVAFVVSGELGGEGLTPAEYEMAAQKVEGFFDKRLKDSFGAANFDQTIVNQTKQDKEQWAVLSGGGVDEVRKILKDAKLDALIRIYFRTSPAYKDKDDDGNDRYSGSATVMVEFIDLASGEKGAMVWSPAMGAFNAGEKVEHPLKQGRDAFEAGMAALDYSCEQVAGLLAGSEAVQEMMGKKDAAVADEEPFRVIFIIEGRIRGDGIGATAANVGGKRLEAMLTGHMKSLIGIRNFDDALLKKAREDAEAWAVLNGDNVDAVQKLLGKMNLDAAIRVYFRTAPAYRRSVGENSIFSGTASMTAQIISSKTGEKSAVVLSPAMGTAEHPARKALDRFDASMSALDYAAREMLKQLEGSQAIGRLNDIRKEQSLNDAPVGNDLQKVLFVIEGEIRGEGINEVEQRVGDMQIETMLSRKLRHALKLKNFDDNTLAKVRGNAEQWAVLMGGEMNEVQTVLDKHNVDSIIRVKYETSAKPYGKADQWGNAIYTAVASVQAEVVGRKDKAVQAKIVSPEMGNEEHKAKAALDEFDAGIAALDYATDKMLNQLLLDSGVVSLMGAPASPQKNTVENIAEEPRKPTVAVLWVKPEFGYWSIPRARQPGLNMRKRQKMKAFVDHVKQTGSIGVDVANYLVQGLVASGQLSPIENSKKSREEVAEIQNKILEYRMAGWVDEKLPITDPVEITKDLGADFVVTAKITKIWENVSSVSGPFVSKGHQSGFAEVEMIVTDVKTGKTKTVKGEGSFGRSGYGLVMTFDPANMALDKFMIGGAVKQALFNAASRLVL